MNHKNYVLNMKKKITISFLLSLLLFLLTFWTAAYSLYAASMAEAMCFFVLTYFILEKYAEPKTYGTPFVIAIIMGRILLDIPIRVMEFRETIFSLFIPIVVMISIFLAALNFKEKNKIVLVLSLIILILLSSIGQAQWLEGFRYGK